MSNPNNDAPSWTIESACNLYNIQHWGAKCFDINDAGHVVAKPLQDVGANVASSATVSRPLTMAFQNKTRHYVRGFSLIEVMLAVVMATVIFTAVGFGLSTGFNLVQVSREQLRANQICLSRMEGIRLCRWGSQDDLSDTQLFNADIVPRTFTDYFYPVGLGETNAFVVYNGTVTLDTNITMSPSPSYVGNLCKVTVQVTWTDQKFNSSLIRTQTMSTLISKNGMQNYVYYH